MNILEISTRWAKGEVVQGRIMMVAGIGFTFIKQGRGHIKLMRHKWLGVGRFDLLAIRTVDLIVA